MRGFKSLVPGAPIIVLVLLLIFFYVHVDLNCDIHFYSDKNHNSGQAN